MGAEYALDTRLEYLQKAIGLSHRRYETHEYQQARTCAMRIQERSHKSLSTTLIAFVGGTGSGKSSLVNAVCAGRYVRTGVLRPTTQNAYAVCSDECADVLDYCGINDFVIEPHIRDVFPALAPRGRHRRLPVVAIVDVPDIDSTHERNREIAQAIIERADVVMWVLDPQKYSDLSVRRVYQGQAHSSHADTGRADLARADAGSVDAGQVYAAPSNAGSADIGSTDIGSIDGSDQETFVILNQLDRLSQGDRDAVLADIRQRMQKDFVHVIATSAFTGEGIDQVRSCINQLIESKSSVLEALHSDIRTCATAWIDAVRNNAGNTHIAELAHASVKHTKAEGHTIDSLFDLSGAVRTAKNHEHEYCAAATGYVQWPPARPVSRIRLPFPVSAHEFELGEGQADGVQPDRAHSEPEVAQLDGAQSEYVASSAIHAARTILMWDIRSRCDEFPQQWAHTGCTAMGEYIDRFFSRSPSSSQGESEGRLCFDQYSNNPRGTDLHKDRVHKAHADKDDGSRHGIHSSSYDGNHRNGYCSADRSSHCLKIPLLWHVINVLQWVLILAMCASGIWALIGCVGHYTEAGAYVPDFFWSNAHVALLVCAITCAVGVCIGAVSMWRVRNRGASLRAVELKHMREEIEQRYRRYISVPMKREYDRYQEFIRALYRAQS